MIPDFRLEPAALFVAILSTIVSAAGGADAQELEPRSYSQAPTGTIFVIGGVGRSQGPIVLDPSLDVNHVEGDLSVATAGLGYVFDLTGRQARILAVGPVAWGAIEGDAHGGRQRQELAGLVDPRIKLSLGLHGAAAVSVSEFGRRSGTRTIVGASVTVTPPWGQYEPARLVNLGFNRWSVKPEVGVVGQVGRWTIEGYAGTWLFTANRSYYPAAATRRQDPVFAVQAHLSYALPRRHWIAIDATWFAGGQTRVERVSSADEQRNTRLGAAYSIPLSRRQSVKLIYSTGASTRRGSAFNTFNVSWQLVWLPAPQSPDHSYRRRSRAILPAW